MLLYFAAMSLPTPATIAEQSAYRATPARGCPAFIGELAPRTDLIVGSGQGGLGQEIPVLRLGGRRLPPGAGGGAREPAECSCSPTSRQ
jgi:hypothetical protein